MDPPTPSQLAYQAARMHEDRGPAIVGVSVAVTALASAGVALRFVAKTTRGPRVGWDDWLAAGGMVLVGTMCAVNVLAVQHGLGKHLVAVEPLRAFQILKIGFALALNYALAHWFIKTAILCTYARLFTLNVRWFRAAVYATAGLVSAWAACQVVLILTACRPLSYFWDRFDRALDPPARGTCVASLPAVELAMSAANTALDLVLLALPLLVLAPLRLAPRRKLAVCAVFAAGAFACAASAAKVAASARFAERGHDPTWDAAPVYVWTVVEAGVGLACACAPNVGPLFRGRREGAAAAGVGMGALRPRKLESEDGEMA